MSLDAKAQTLGYELPSAESEIKRLEEVQRSLRDEFARKRRGKPEERSNLAGWLERHPDTTLGDLNLASSPMPIKALSIATGVPTGTMIDNEVEVIPDALGVGRYAMRGDLRTWLDHVAELGDRLKLDAGDWNAQDEKELERALAETTKLVAGKNDERNLFLCRESLTSLLEMLSVIGARRFYADVKAPLHEALDGLVVQVREWYAAFLKFGHGGRVATQRKEEEESRKTETEDDIRKRQLAVGIAAAAHSQHILLTQAQLDQVLAAFYHQSHAVSRREKGRIERKLVESLTREDNVTANLQRMNRALQEKVSALQEAIERHLHPSGSTGEFDATANALNELRKPSAVENMNQMTQAMAEVLSKKRIREAESKVASLTEAYTDLRNHHEQNVILVERMQKENKQLSDAVAHIQKLWDVQIQAKAQQEEERRRMYGGLQSDQQFYLSSLTTLMNASLSTVSTLLANASTQSERHTSVVQLLSAEQRRILPRDAFASGLTEAKRLVLSWTTAVYNCAVSEGARATLQQLARLALEDDANSGNDPDEGQSDGYRAAKNALRSTLASPQQEGTSSLSKAFSAVSREYADPDRELVGAVAQRLDTAISEAKTKFRETRYMRSMLWWLIGAVDALCNGTYSDAQHGLSSADNSAKKKGRGDRRTGAESESREVTFPPAAVVAQDADYSYAWVDESKSLERIFMSLRALLGSSAEKSNINNVLLTAIETAADQTALMRARRQTTISSFVSEGSTANDVVEREIVSNELAQATASAESLVDLRLTNALEKGRGGVTTGRQVLLQIQQQAQEQQSQLTAQAAAPSSKFQRESLHTEVEAMYHAVHS